MASLDQIALMLVPGVGPSVCRRLAARLGDPAQLFSLGKADLDALFPSRTAMVNAILAKATHARAEQELHFCQQHGIRPLFLTDDDFPERLKRAEVSDGPALLYCLGAADLNARRTLAVVGTRRATVEGRDNTARLVAGLAPLGLPVVSGLAYGIDTAAHSAALDAGLPTVAVLGHGLDRIYPPQNRQLASRIVAAGGTLLSEYPSGTAINPRHFPARNRIIAALADAVVVAEAADKGGALITAAIAASYRRDVFAFPGRLSDPTAAGTLRLIATRRADLIRSAADLAYAMNWPLDGEKAVQPTLFPTLGPDEERLLALLREAGGPLGTDDLSRLSGQPLAKVAATLFSLEMNQAVRTLPGHLYKPL